MLLIVALGAVHTSDALGQNAKAEAAPTARDPERAEKLFTEAKVLLGKEDWAGAEKKLFEVWALNPTFDVAVNLGQTQFRLKKYRQAAQNLSFASRHWPIIGPRETRDRAEARLKELRPMLTAVTVTVNVKGAMIRVNGEMVGEAPLEGEVFAEAGPVTVEASLLGYVAAKQVIDGKKGALETVTLTLVADALPLAPTASPTASASNSAPPPPSVGVKSEPQTVWIVAGASVFALGMGLGIGATVAANSSSAEADTIGKGFDGRSDCAGAAGAGDCGALKDALKSQDAMTTVAGVAFAAGAAAAAATGIYVLWPRENDAGTAVVPVVGADGAGFLMTGKF